MISDPKYEYDYSEFYQRYSAISNLNRLICPLFKDPLVNNEKEEPRGRRIVKSLKSHCVNKITSYNQLIRQAREIVPREILSELVETCVKNGRYRQLTALVETWPEPSFKIAPRPGVWVTI